jgi:hypothetical protein
MAIALDQNLGSTSAGASAATIVLTTSQAAASGTLVTVFLGSTAQLPSAVSDNSGNGYTWTVEQTQNNGASNSGIAWTLATAGLASGTQITGTYAASTANRTIGAASFTGVATSSPVDVKNGRSHFGTGWAGTSLNSTGDNYLLVSVSHQGAGTGSPTSTSAANYNEIHDLALSSASAMTTVYRVLGAAGAYNASGTWTDSTGADETTAQVVFKVATSISKTLTPALETDAAQALGFTQGGPVYEASWGDMGIEYGMLPFSGENFPLPSGRRRYSLPPMSP